MMPVASVFRNVELWSWQRRQNQLRRAELHIFACSTFLQKRNAIHEHDRKYQLNASTDESHRQISQISTVTAGAEKCFLAGISHTRSHATLRNAYWASARTVRPESEPPVNLLEILLEVASVSFVSH
jgi:hypothetical protein